jgi:cell division protein FtsI (penicillin-binding protein 3)
MMERQEKRGRIVVAGVLLGLGFVMILARLFHLQVIQAADLGQKAGRQHHKVLTVEGGRGTIYDRNGKILSMNLDVPSVFGEPRAIADTRGTASRLAGVLLTDVSRMEAKLKNGRDFVWLERRLAPEKVQQVRALSLPGIGLVPEGRHFYPNGTLLAHVLGFANIDNQGLEGLERRYDGRLRGERGHFVIERDALGGAVFPKGLNYDAPSAGQDLILTIDEVIQYIAEYELEQAVTKTRADAGIVIVSEPKSGAILALAVCPTFDPNRPGSDANLWRNRAIADTYEPGSTLKIVTAAAALEEELFSPDDLVYGEDGKYVVENTVVHDHHKQGWMTFAEVLQKSSNIGIIKVGQRLGPDRLAKYLADFGFGQKTEVDLEGEVRGLLKEEQAWGRRSLASISMGQEVGITALQLTVAASAIANGGWVMRPYLVSEIKAPSGQTLARFEPGARRRVVSSATSRMMIDILRGVVLPGGTGTLAALPAYDVAGKTGTAQKLDPATRRYSATRTVASFVGFLPADDPQLTILVVIDEPKVDQWGGTVAAPVFQRIAAQAVRHLGIPPKDFKGQVLAARAPLALPEPKKASWEYVVGR